MEKPIIIAEERKDEGNTRKRNNKNINRYQE